jgi:hypothetical protein
MLDGFARKNNHHLVVDLTNYGVLTTATSVSVANAVAQGLVNTSVLDIWLPDRAEYFKDFAHSVNKNCTLIKKTSRASISSDANIGKAVEKTPSGQHFDILETNVAEVSADWLVKRKLANDRQFSMSLLERKIERYMSRAKHFTGDELFIPFMSQQLPQCDHARNIYTPAVTEWATIAGMSPGAAFNELSMKVSGCLLSVSRLNAIWVKYVDKINRLDDKLEMTQCLHEQLEMELRSGSR